MQASLRNIASVNHKAITVPKWALIYFDALSTACFYDKYSTNVSRYRPQLMGFERNPLEGRETSIFYPARIPNTNSIFTMTAAQKTLFGAERCFCTIINFRNRSSQPLQPEPQ